MTQEVKCLPFKHVDLSLTPRSMQQKLDAAAPVCCPSIPVPRQEAEKREAPESSHACWPGALSQAAETRASTRLKKRTDLYMCVLAHECVYSHTRT